MHGKQWEHCGCVFSEVTSPLRDLDRFCHVIVARLGISTHHTTGQPKYWLVSELGGPTLTAYAREHVRSRHVLWELFHDVASALRELQQQAPPVVLGGLDPERIMVFEEAGRAVAKVVQLGTSRYATPQSASSLRTPAAAPTNTTAATAADDIFRYGR